MKSDNENAAGEDAKLQLVLCLVEDFNYLEVGPRPSLESRGGKRNGVTVGSAGLLGWQPFRTVKVFYRVTGNGS